ncbi:MAG: hypothetical protein ACERKX_14525 [Anaerolineales bacterium]
MKPHAVLDRLQDHRIKREIRHEIQRFEDELARAKLESAQHKAPVAFFNASTRIHRLSLNGAFSLLASWALRAVNEPVQYLVCNEGMTQCILGWQKDRPGQPPPCNRCMDFSNQLFPSAIAHTLHLDSSLATKTAKLLEGKSVQDLLDWEYNGAPLGQLCLPGVRWVLRRHHLPDDENIRRLVIHYLSSSVSLYHRFIEYFNEQTPRALVIFNGILFPEAIARWVARSMAIPTVTHEVGLRPMSAFFSHREATFRQLDLPTQYHLSAAQDLELNEYLQARFEGNFSMAGIQFWPEIEGLPGYIDDAIDSHRQTVTVFTNVIFDTSQIHANSLFSHMFEWLDVMEDVFKAHPDTLFVLRAHPDEDRPGKSSEENVASWVLKKRIEEESNVIFISPSDTISSYELIRRSKFVMIYNSSIGLEAAIMGAPVLAAARSRFTHEPTVFYPDSQQEYIASLNTFLDQEVIDVPASFVETARKLMYYELFQGSLDLSQFLKEDPTMQGMVKFQALTLGGIRDNPALNIIRDGILHGEPFLLD